MSRRRFHSSRISSSPGRASIWRGRRYQRGSTSHVWQIIALSGAALAVVCLLIAGVVWGIEQWRQAHPPGARAEKKPAAAHKLAKGKHAAVKPVVRAPLRPGPSALQNRLNDIAKAYGEPVGIAVADVEKGWGASVNGDKPYPQQSVSKLWVAATVLEAVDQGELTLDSPVLMTAADRSVFNQPLGRSLPPEGFATTIQNLLRHALVFSDNSANDTLIRVVGLDNVRQMLVRHGLSGIQLGADERRLQSLIAGLTWQPELSEGRAFEQARAKLPKEHREAALDAYLAAPVDGATPLGLVQALGALKRGEVLAPETRGVLFDILAKARTGPSRLKGSLPAGWKIAHKTGTGQDFAGSSIGINDVAILTAPDGRDFAVAVLIPRTKKPVRERLEMMQAVTTAVAEQWKAEGGKA